MRADVTPAKELSVRADVTPTPAKERRYSHTRVGVTLTPVQVMEEENRAAT